MTSRAAASPMWAPRGKRCGSPYAWPRGRADPSRTPVRPVSGDADTEGRLMLRKLAILLAAMLVAGSAGAQAPWRPTKQIEFIVTSGPGGGTDTFARTIQAMLTKYKLIDQPIVVLNKGGGSGAEGYVYGKASATDPYKVTFGTNNEYLLPLVAKLAWKGEDFTPIAGTSKSGFSVNQGRRQRCHRNRSRGQSSSAWSSGFSLAISAIPLRPTRIARRRSPGTSESWPTSFSASSR